MNTVQIDPRALAAQRRGRIQALRGRVAAAAVTLFLALWGVLFVQLATGHDPGLGNAATAAVVQSSDPDATTDATSDADAFDDDDGSAASAVTTRQS